MLLVHTSFHFQYNRGHHFRTYRIDALLVGAAASLVSRFFLDRRRH
jgi:hypothetical protein